MQRFRGSRVVMMTARRGSAMMHRGVSPLEGARRTRMKAEMRTSSSSPVACSSLRGARLACAVVVTGRRGGGAGDASASTPPSPLRCGVPSRRYATQPKMSGSSATYRSRSVYIPSLGQIVDPLVPPSGVELLNPLKLWARLRAIVMNMVSTWAIRKQLKKEKHIAPTGFFFLDRWTKEACHNYRAFCEARANGDERALRGLTTDEFFDVVKGSLIPPNNKLSREWNINNLNAKPLTIRMVAVQEPDAKFAQLLVRFTSQQTLKLMDSKGSLISGSTSAVPVTEHYVLERPLQDVHLFSWKFMGKLDPTRKEPLVKPQLDQ